MLTDALAVAAVVAVIAVIAAFAWHRATGRRRALASVSGSTDARLAAFVAPLLGDRADTDPLKPFPQSAADGALLPGPALPQGARPAPLDPGAFFGEPVRPPAERAARPSGPAGPQAAAYKASVDALAAALRRAADDVLRAAGSTSDPDESCARVVGAATAALGELPLRQVVAAAHAAARPAPSERSAP